MCRLSTCRLSPATCRQCGPTFKARLELFATKGRSTLFTCRRRQATCREATCRLSTCRQATDTCRRLQVACRRRHVDRCMCMKCAWIFNCYTWPWRNSYANGGRRWGRFGVFVSGSGDCRRPQTPTAAPSMPVMLGPPLDVFATTISYVTDDRQTDATLYQYHKRDRKYSRLKR